MSNLEPTVHLYEIEPRHSENDMRVMVIPYSHGSTVMFIRGGSEKTTSLKDLIPYLKCERMQTEHETIKVCSELGDLYILLNGVSITKETYSEFIKWLEAVYAELD